MDWDADEWNDSAIQSVKERSSDERFLQALETCAVGLKEVHR